MMGLSLFVVASNVCSAAAAGFGILVAVLGFLEVHLEDKTVVRGKLESLYGALDESTLARLPRVLFEQVGRFHSGDPRRGPLTDLLRRWSALGAFIMLLAADALLAFWYPNDLLEAYRSMRRSILEEVPVTLYNDDVTFVVGLIGFGLLFVILVRVTSAAPKIETRKPFGERPSFRNAMSLDWQRILIELGGITAAVILAMLLGFGMEVAIHRLAEIPTALGVAISVLSAPFLFVLFFYLVFGGLQILEVVLKLVILSLCWIKGIRSRFGRHLQHDNLVLDFLFERFEYCVLFVLGLSLSMALSFLALALGHALYPDIVAPRTWQLFGTNALSDGLTLSATFLAVRWAVAPGKLLGRVPLAILFCLGISAVLSGLALYFGLLGTAQALSPGAVLNVLFGRSPDGQMREYGPYFWIMRTSFLPIALYLLVLLVFWLVKVALDPAAWIVRHATRRDLPLTYLAAAAGIYAAAFTALGVLFDQIGRAVEAMTA